MSKFNNGDITDVLDSFFIDYAIDDDDDETNIQELMQQRSDMNKAVNEWYAKAKAFDRIVEERNRIGKLMHNKEYPQVFTDEAFWNIDDIINDTESGELE